MIIKKCKNCGKEFAAKQSSKQHCSPECFSIYRSRPDILKETLLRRKESSLKRYGVDNPSKSLEIKEKAAKTCMERYGAVSPTQNKTIYKKQIQTNIERYGVGNPQQNKDIQQRQMDTLTKHYGVTVPLKNKEILDRLKTTCINKYGVNNPSKLENVKNKIKHTNIERYGFNSPTQNEEIRTKQLKTCFDKYGYDYCQQNIEIKQKSAIKYKKTFFKRLFSTDRLNNKVLPQFDEHVYINTKTGSDLLFKCKKCNRNFYDNLLSGHIPRCEVCYPPKSSIIESEIISFIKSLLPDDMVYERDRKILNGLELDVYIPDKKLAIEFNGNYWHSEIGGKKYKNYHLNKTEKCELQNIRLIHIFEDEWISNQYVVENKLKHILKINTNKSIYARNCNIKEISNIESSNFLNKYHIQGSSAASIRIGAFYHEKLVSVMTFGGLRTPVGSMEIPNHYEMYRFCIGDDNVIGIGGKLFSHFIKQYTPIKIITYADRRWSGNSTFYTKIGMNFIKNTPPNYWYIDKKYIHRIHRYNFRKSELSKKLSIFDPNLSEWENMRLNGYDRIWDCGDLKYEWKSNNI